MNKITNGQDKGKWITTNVRAALDEHWGSTNFLNKSSTVKANRFVDRGASAYCGGSISTASHFETLIISLYIHICFQRPPTAWEAMEKTKKSKSREWVNDKSCEFAEKFQHRREEILQHLTEEDTSTLDSFNILQSISIAPVEDKIEEMRETINKLNAKLLAKAYMEKTLEEKMLQLMENHDHQSQEM
ncbi:hypothetical protein GmHk_14G040611 [Glycine max]|nr:hypothetical protein GmHk_14G040611 [Glycine max]